MRSSTGSLSRLSDFLANLWGWPAIATMIIAAALIALAVLYHDRRSFRAASVELLREAEAIKSHEHKFHSRP
jgi:predicted MFS family arabinose efflux permease